MPGDKLKKTLVLNFEDTILHNEYKLGTGSFNYKRPYIGKFLIELAKYYEIIVFSNHKDSDVNKIFFIKNKYHNLIPLKNLDDKRCLQTIR